MNGILIGAAPYLGLLSTSSVNIPGGRAGPAAREAVRADAFFGSGVMNARRFAVRRVLR